MFSWARLHEQQLIYIYIFSCSLWYAADSWFWIQFISSGFSWYESRFQNKPSLVGFNSWFTIINWKHLSRNVFKLFFFFFWSCSIHWKEFNQAARSREINTSFSPIQLCCESVLPVEYAWCIASIMPLIFSPTQSLHLTNNKNANTVVPSKKLIMPKRLISKMYEEISHGITINTDKRNGALSLRSPIRSKKREGNNFKGMCMFYNQRNVFFDSF